MIARLTPFELAFGAERFDREAFPAIRDEATERGVDTDAREAFLMLANAGELLRELGPEPDAPGTAATSHGPPDSVRQFGALLFQAYRFWADGRHLLTIDSRLLRDLLAAGPIGEWRFGTPHTSGYVQVPRHLLWARIDDEAPAEAVDGFFWVHTDRPAGRQGRIELLVALGMHPGRPGFSVIDTVAPLPAASPGHWGDEDARTGAADFENILPGGEMRDLLAVASTTELLKLASRIFHYVAHTPAALRPADASQRDETSTHALPPSSIPAIAITRPD